MRGRLFSTGIFKAALLLTLLGAGNAALAQVALEDIALEALPGERFQIQLTFSGSPPEPEIFEIQDPASLSLDFANVVSRLNERRFAVQEDIADSILVLEAQGRTRMVVNLNARAEYTSRVQGNSLFLVLEGGAGGGAQAATAAASAGAAAQAGASAPSPAASDIDGVDFRRGEDNTGQIIVSLANRNLTGNVNRAGQTLTLELRNADIAESQQERIDVTDFATPVRFINVYGENNNVIVEVDITGDYEYVAYQTGGQFTINVTQVEATDGGDGGPDFTGERISLNFQDIPIRSVLQTLAEFQDFSLVVSDAVTGNITLRLDQVPWDQALDLVLRSRGLGSRQEGSVLYVAPVEDITSAEIQQLESEQQQQTLAPLETAYIPINYAVATEVLALIRGEGGEDGGSGLLSDRGSASVDSRTNTLIVRDAASVIEEVRDLLAELDIPVRQVQIQARIVNAEASFSEALGIRWGGVQTVPDTGDNFTITGSLEGLGADPTLNDQLFVDLGAAGASSSLSLGYAGNNGLLQLELSALEDSGNGEVVAQPSIMTQDQQVARIESGLQIPYQAQAGGTAGGSTTEFVSAVLSLEVTPQITPDGRIIMLLDIHQDAVAPTQGGGAPAISTNNITTRVLVDNGDTIVLGGVFREEVVTTVSKTMLLGDLPYVGNLFRRTENDETKTELLIFITPSIVNEL